MPASSQAPDDDAFRLDTSEFDQAIAELEAERSQGGGSATPGDLADLYNRRGCLRYRVGSLAKACEDFDAALRLRKDFTEAYNNRACARAEIGDAPRARIDLARALALRADLPEARENLLLLSQVHDPSPTAAGPSRTTVSAVEAGAPSSFFTGLVQFLEANVRVRRGFEDCREDAISEIVTRVLAHSQGRDLSLADALREVRRSSTRSWARTLMQRFGRRGGDLDADSVAGPAPVDSESAPTLLRLGALFEEVEQRLLVASRPSKRRRRRIVWGIYLRALLDGVQLTRAEIIAAARELGLGVRAVTDRQIERDLDILVSGLRASAPSPETSRDLREP